MSSHQQRPYMVVAVVSAADDNNGHGDHPPSGRGCPCRAASPPSPPYDPACKAFDAVCAGLI
ncbi:hypothetical protein E2562_018277 [Oryza meyeriana var. granulata]|uniref:Uncharacterized protein n=1 Tax=Oryza meyeriana var. granulata TaxID=110450 RepID=A0A6G1CQ92_9ORYZ|nr:hypothetical protein E2562_018277 [Oryza meyeriana var. granulata]